MGSEFTVLRQSRSPANITFSPDHSHSRSTHQGAGEVPARRGQIFKACRSGASCTASADTARLWLTQSFILCCALITARLSTLYLVRALVFVPKVCVTERRPRQRFSARTAARQDTGLVSSQADEIHNLVASPRIVDLKLAACTV